MAYEPYEVSKNPKILQVKIKKLIKNSDIFVQGIVWEGLVKKWVSSKCFHYYFLSWIILHLLSFRSQEWTRS